MQIEKIANSKENWSRVSPDFIYNRFDLWKKGISILYQINGRVIPVYINGIHAILGVWQTYMSLQEIENLCKRILTDCKEIIDIRIYRAIPVDLDAVYGNIIRDQLIIEIDETSLHEDYKIILPATEEELEQRNSKKSRYNQRREKRLAYQECGEPMLKGWTSDKDTAKKLIAKFQRYKSEDIGVYPRNTVDEYIEKYHLSHIYGLFYGNNLVAVLTACEQCDSVYLDNLAYDPKYAKYSPGKMIYDLWLRKMIEKGKGVVYLEGGDYAYKEHYGSDKTVVVDFYVYRKSLRSKTYRIAKKIRRKIVDSIPMDARNTLWSIRMKGKLQLNE